MDILFQDPEEIPLPKNEVRIRDLKADPWPDGQRVRVYVETDPFQYRPNLDIIILGEDGSEISSISIIESMTRKMEMTMHLRETGKGDQCQLRVNLYYFKDVEGREDLETDLNDPQIVDRSSIRFTIPGQKDSEPK